MPERRVRVTQGGYSGHEGNLSRYYQNSTFSCLVVLDGGTKVRLREEDIEGVDHPLDVLIHGK